MEEPFYSLSSVLNLSQEWSDLINNACFDVISRLPEEISTLIFRLLDAESLFSAAFVNHNWLAICHSDSILRNRVRSYIRRSRKRPRNEDDQESPSNILSQHSQASDNTQSSSPEPYMIRRKLLRLLEQHQDVVMGKSCYRNNRRNFSQFSECLVAKRRKRFHQPSTEPSSSKTEHSRWLRRFGSRSSSEESLVPTLRMNLRI